MVKPEEHLHLFGLLTTFEADGGEVAEARRAGIFACRFWRHPAANGELRQGCSENRQPRWLPYMRLETLTPTNRWAILFRPAG